MNNILKICLLIASTLLLNACEPKSIEQAAPVKENLAADKVGLANPASTYCIAQGGSLDIQTEDAGQVGYCTLPDGQRIEEWQLYKRDHQQAVDANEMQKIPNPAAQYCLEIGGTSDFADGSCTLPSGEKVDQWTLFHQHKLISI